MLINLRNALMAGKRLPYDAELEYLESTGTQLIYTGIVPDNLTGVKISMYVPSASSTWQSWGGCRKNASNSKYSFNMQYQSSYCPNGRMTVGGETTSALIPSAAISGDCKWEYIVSGDTGTLTVNGAVVGSHVSSTAWSTNVEMTLFAGNNGGQTNESSKGFKIYRVEIFSESTLVRDFIPVRVGTVGYMYDRVTRKLFVNAGTGAFTYGNDLKYPIPSE
jgi:hypothetical protein